MAEKNIYLKALMIVLILGVPTMLLLAFGSDRLSPIEWAIGISTWAATLLIWTAVRKWAGKKDLASSPEPRVIDDDRSRKRMSHDIRKRKIWIAVLIVLLPVGVANGIAHRAWLPTLTGSGISLLIMYVSIREIKERRKRLSLTRE